MNIRKILFNGVCMVAVVLSCNSNQSVKKQEKPAVNNCVKKDSTKDAGKEKALTSAMFKLNETAKFFAGMPVDSASEFFNLTKTNEWKNHHQIMDSAFKKFERNAAKAGEWRDKEISDLKSIKTVFYPFSGPDFLYVNTFFPDATKYILIGMEENGSVPRLDSIKVKSMGEIFKKLQYTLHDILQLSFFVTYDMHKDFSNQTIDGTTPILMIFMARTGKVIVNIAPMKINSKGDIDSLGKGEKFKNVVNKVMAISYHDKGCNIIKTVYYLKNNLGSAAMARNTTFTKCLQKLDSSNTVTLVKSAQYLMHQPEGFSIIRNIILSRSSAILQDDTGIPYRWYDQKKWKLTLYGTYVRPIKSFTKCYQTDMYSAFQQSAKPLGFHVGYGKVFNLELARRK